VEASTTTSTTTTPKHVKAHTQVTLAGLSMGLQAVQPRILRVTTIHRITQQAVHLPESRLPIITAKQLIPLIITIKGTITIGGVNLLPDRYPTLFFSLSNSTAHYNRDYYPLAIPAETLDTSGIPTFANLPE